MKNTLFCTNLMKSLHQFLRVIIIHQLPMILVQAIFQGIIHFPKSKDHKIDFFR